MGPLGVTRVGERCHPLFKEGSHVEIKLGMDAKEVEGGVDIELSEIDGKGTCCETSLVSFPPVIHGNKILCTASQDILLEVFFKAQ